MGKEEIMELLNNIHKEVFSDYCEYCRLSGECEGKVEDKLCNKFKSIMDEIDNRLDKFDD